MSQWDFFYRIEGLNLIPGSKSAGFTVIVSSAALRQLSTMPVGPDEYQVLAQQMQERIKRAGLLPKTLISSSGMALWQKSACPLMFTTNAMFGASVGADPNQLQVLAEDYGLEFIGPTMEFTPHNVDSAAHAMALLIMVETWGEWARGKLAAGDLPEQGLQQKVAAWAEKALPAGANHLKKIQKELDELVEAPGDPAEMGDVCLALMVHASKHGVDLLAAAAEKFEVVQTRTYGPCDEHGISQHIAQPGLPEVSTTEGGPK